MHNKTTKFWYPELSNIGKCVIGDNCTIHSHVWISDGVVIGKNVKIEAFAFIPNGVTIEDGVFVGPHVCFTNDVYPPRDVFRKTIVHSGAAIGANSTIIAGVNIGKDSLVGAGSVVTKDVLPNSLVYGNPARFVRFLKTRHGNDP